MEIFEISRDGSTYLRVELENSSQVASKLTRLENINKSLAELQAAKEKIEAELASVVKEAGGKAIRGNGGRKFTVIEATRKNVAWKDIAVEMSIPSEVIERHTKVSQYTSFRYTPAKY